MHTPDFFVIYRDTAGWVECKTEEDLLKLAVDSPNRYQLDENNEWICPPGIEWAKQFNLSYELHSSKKINWTFQRNIEYLADYFRKDQLEIPENVFYVITETVRKEPAISLENLIEKTSNVATPDDIFSLIAFERIYVDLQTNLLPNPEKVKVFVSEETAKAYSNVIGTGRINATPQSCSRPNAVEVKSNCEILWDGRGWKILNVGEFNITLINESDETLQIQKRIFESFVKNGDIVGVNSLDEKSDFSPKIREIFSKSSVKDFKTANYRAEIVKAFLKDDLCENISQRTLREWKANYRKAEIQFGIGMGYLGLIPKPRQGNVSTKILEENKELLIEFIENEYETIVQENRTSVYKSYSEECKNRFFEPASFRTFCEYVKKRDMKEQTLKRKGKRAAYKHEEFYWELSTKTPRHGERPFHIAHIDHTELDIELVDSDTGNNLGRPWLTILIDAFSRKILAVYLTFDPPSYRSNLMILRECVRRHGRLPQILVVDGGKEFSSIYFETFLAMYEVTKKTRPPAKPRFGSVVERIFGTTNTMFINNLQGNTQITKNVRQITKGVNPKNHAVWNLGSLYEKLCEFLYEIYDQKEHSTLNQTPREVFAQGLLKSGTRSHLLIPYNEEFKIMTLPSTRKGTAMIDNSRGIKVNRIHYFCDEFRNPDLHRMSVEVRYDPWNMGVAYAFVNGVWQECLSDYYQILQGKTEKEMNIAASEMRKTMKDSDRRLEFSAGKYVKFKQSTKASENLLKQSMKDKELGKVHSSMGSD
jgi:transposase InsO family protein